MQKALHLKCAFAYMHTYFHTTYLSVLLAICWKGPWLLVFHAGVVVSINSCFCDIYFLATCIFYISLSLSLLIWILLTKCYPQHIMYKIIYLFRDTLSLMSFSFILLRRKVILICWRPGLLLDWYQLCLALFLFWAVQFRFFSFSPTGNWWKRCWSSRMCSIRRKWAPFCIS